MLMALVIFPAARTSGAARPSTPLPQHGGHRGYALRHPSRPVSGQLGAIALAASTVVVLGCGHLLTRQLGGLTGDSYGAIAVVTETVVLFVAVALSAATQ